MRLLLAGLALAEMGTSAALISVGVRAVLAWFPVLLAVAYVAASATLGRGARSTRWLTSVALAVGGLYASALALFSLLLTRFLGPADTGADVRAQALVVTVIAVFVATALVSFITLAMLWTRKAADHWSR